MSGVWVQGDIDVITAFDAEFCPEVLPAGAGVALVYIGGTSAAHAWDDAERARVAHMPRLPVWVPTPGRDDPRAAAAACLAELRALGVPTAAENGGIHVRVMWDLETGTEPDPAWLRVARSRMHAGGFYTLPYGSLDTVFGYDPCGGYMVANPTKVPHFYQHPNVVGTQWIFDVGTPGGGRVDLWQMVTDLVPHLWRPAGVPIES